jgi:hypothetical protein
MASLAAPAVLEAAGGPPHSAGSRSFYDLAVSWQADMAGERYAVAGSVTNAWVILLHELELNVRLYGKKGSEIGRATFFFIPRDISPAESMKFGLAIPVPPGEMATRLEFRFVYSIDNDDFGTIPMFRGFDTKVQDGSGTAPSPPSGQPRPW